MKFLATPQQRQISSSLDPLKFLLLQYMYLLLGGGLPILPALHIQIRDVVHIHGFGCRLIHKFNTEYIHLMQVCPPSNMCVIHKVVSTI